MRCMLLLTACAYAETDFDRALALVEEAQAKCDAPIDALRTSPRDGGFANGIHGVMTALSRSLLAGRVLALEPKDHCTARGRQSYAATPLHDVACAYGPLFEALSHCPASGRPVRGTTRFKLSGPAAFEEHNSSFVKGVVLQGLHDRPPYFWAAVLARYATRPTPCLNDRVDFLQHALFGDLPLDSVIAAHARVDRAKAKEARTHPTKSYASRIISVVNAYGYAGLLVCADRPDAAELVAKDVQRWRPALKIGVAFTPRGHFARGASQACARAPALGIASEVLLMARCGFVIGTFSSNIGRLVHALQGSQHRFHDLDGLPAWYGAGDGLIENNIRGFWQHFASHQHAHCVLKDPHHHRPHCAAAADATPAGLFLKGVCIAGCGRLDIVAKIT